MARPRQPLVHGTRSAYTNHSCRCDACRTANSTSQAKTRLKKFYGTYDKYVDAKEVRNQLLVLLGSGLSLAQIARATGISRQGLGRILAGHTTRALRTSAEKIRAVPADPLVAGGPDLKVPAVGAVRRLQALGAIGYTMVDLAGRLGVDRINIDRYLRGRWRRMPHKFHADVCALYEQLWNRPVDNHRAKSMASAKGWAPPMAWDDDTIDDPSAVPELGAKVRIRDRQFEDLVWLLESGCGWAEACSRAGYASMHAVKRAAAHAGRYDVVAGMPDPHYERIVFNKKSA